MNIASRIGMTIIVALVSACSHTAVAEENTNSLAAWLLMSNNGSKNPYPGFVIENTTSKHSIRRASEIFEQINYRGFRAIPLEARGVFEWALIANDVPRKDVYKKLGSTEGVLQAIEMIKKANPTTYWYISEFNKIPIAVYRRMVPIITFRSDHNDIPLSSEGSNLGIDPAESSFWEERESFWRENEELFNSILAFHLEKEKGHFILICPLGKRCCPPGMKGCRKPPPCPKHLSQLLICPPSSGRSP